MAEDASKCSRLQQVAAAAIDALAAMSACVKPGSLVSGEVFVQEQALQHPIHESHGVGGKAPEVLIPGACEELLDGSAPST